MRPAAVLLLVAVLAPAAAPGADAPAPAPLPAPPPGTVRFFNRDIVTLRAPYYGVSPAERAVQSAARIADAVGRGGPGSVRTATTAEGVGVTVDGVYVLRILSGDLDAEDGQTFEQARVVVGQRLQEAIEAARSSRRGRDLLRALALTAAFTLAFGAALWLLARARLWLRRRVDAVLARRLRLREQERTRIIPLLRTLGHLAFLLVALALAEEWLRLVFGLFPYTRPWSERLTVYAGATAAQVGGAMIDAAPGLGMVALIAVLAHLASRAVGVMALGIAAGRYRLLGLDRDTAPLARRLAATIVWLFALAMAYPYLPGSSSEAFKGLSVLVGLMLSLGVSGLVGQAAGGVILTFGRVLRPGEWVRVGDVEGTVTSVGMFSTRLRTPTDEEVNVPNSVLLGSVTRNYSRPAAAEASVLESSVTIGYGTPWRQVHAMLLEAAARTPEVERDPPPVVLQIALSDFYVHYSLRVRLADQRRRPQALSALNASVQDVFNEHGVQIMSPHYAFDPAAPVLVPKTHWFAPPASRPG